MSDDVTIITRLFRSLLFPAHRLESPPGLVPASPGGEERSPLVLTGPRPGPGTHVPVLAGRHQAGLLEHQGRQPEEEVRGGRAQSQSYLS